MARLRIDELESGMVVARDVCDRSGRLLLSAGSPLQERHLTVFRTWGVYTVDISTPEELPGPSQTIPLDPELWAEVEPGVAHRFRNTDRSNPAINVLFELSVQRLAQRQLQRKTDGVS